MRSTPSYLFPFKSIKERQDPCSLCKNRTGNLVGQVSYFELENFDMCQCPRCGLISTDPIPSESIVNEGCSLLYASGYGMDSAAAMKRGFIKSFRRGSAFGRRLLKQGVSKNDSLQVLEIGAGDGYFSSGIRAEIPNAKIWLMDVVEDLIRYYSAHHECETLLGQFETTDFGNQKFDLIIFRDLLEHVRDPFLFLQKANEVTRAQSRLFFITPNGREDFWLINQRYMKTGERTLLLLNHFHYFLPDTLDCLLRESGFSVAEGYKFGLKQHRQGLGHREFWAFEKQVAPTLSEEYYSIYTAWKHDPRTVRGHLLGKPGFFSRFYGFFNDRDRQQSPFFSDRGHEFSVFARKNK